MKRFELKTNVMIIETDIKVFTTSLIHGFQCRTHLDSPQDYLEIILDAIDYLSIETDVLQYTDNNKEFYLTLIEMAKDFDQKVYDGLHEILLNKFEENIKKLKR